MSCGRCPFGFEGVRREREARVPNGSTVWLKPLGGSLVQAPRDRRAATSVTADPSAVMAMELHRGTVS
jgi:hypothetical protein